VEDQIAGQPGITQACVSSVWGERLTAARLSPGARRARPMLVQVSGVPFHPQWALRAFTGISVREDLSEGYGYR
jgi:hypothetical protein